MSAAQQRCDPGVHTMMNIPKTKSEADFARQLGDYLPPMPAPDVAPPARASLDLHGLQLEDALEQVRRYIVTAAQSGMEQVRIIYGQGRHSPDGQAVLRTAVQRLLSRELRPYVQRFKAAPRKQGGAGVAIVYLCVAVDSQARDGAET